MKTIDKESLRKIGYFFLICFAALGALGTIGWLIYTKAWAILVGALVVDYLAARPFVALVKKLLN